MSLIRPRHERILPMKTFVLFLAPVITAIAESSGPPPRLVPDPDKPEMVVRLESVGAFDETLSAFREQTAGREAAVATMHAEVALLRNIGLEGIRDGEPVLVAFWNLSWPLDLGKLDFLAALPIRRGSVDMRMRVRLRDEEAQTVGGLLLKPLGPPEEDGVPKRRPWVAFDGARTIVASDPALAAALPALLEAPPPVPGAPVSLLVPSAERLLGSAGRLVSADDPTPDSAIGPRTFFLPPEQSTPNELGGTFSFTAAGVRGRGPGDGSQAVGFSATPAEGVLLAFHTRRLPEPGETNAPPPDPAPLAAADLRAIPPAALLWTATTDGTGSFSGVGSTRSFRLGFNDTPTNHVRKAAFDAFFAALDAATAARGRTVRFLEPADGGALRWESRVETSDTALERALAAAYGDLSRTEGAIAGTNTPACFRTNSADFAPDGLSCRVRTGRVTAASYNMDHVLAGLFGEDFPWSVDVGETSSALAIGRAPATPHAADGAAADAPLPVDLAAPRRWFPDLAPFSVSALRPVPILARLAPGAAAESDPVVLETVSCRGGEQIWTLSAPPDGVRSLSALIGVILSGGGAAVPVETVGGIP